MILSSSFPFWRSEPLGDVSGSQTSGRVCTGIGCCRVASEPAPHLALAGQLLKTFTEGLCPNPAHRGGGATSQFASSGSPIFSTMMRCGALLDCVPVRRTQRARCMQARRGGSGIGLSTGHFEWRIRKTERLSVKLCLFRRLSRRWREGGPRRDLMEEGWRH